MTLIERDIYEHYYYSLHLHLLFSQSDSQTGDSDDDLVDAFSKLSVQEDKSFVPSSSDQESESSQELQQTSKTKT